MERQPSEREDGGRRKARAYQAALEAALAIPIALGLGLLADSKLGTAPVGLLIGLGLGFTTFIVRLTRMRGMVEREAAEAEQKERNE